MQTYSFADVVASITGPGGAFPLGSGSGNAKEGITITMSEDKNNMLIGADGNGMHSLHAGNGGVVTVRLLKTSPVNALLAGMYFFQKQSALTWGKNVIVVTDLHSLDVISAVQAAFKKFPEIKYQEDGQTNEFTWDAIQITQILGPATL